MRDKTSAQLRARRLLMFIIIVPFLFLLAVAVVAHQTSVTQVASAGWVAQTLEIKRTLAELFARLVDIETSQRGFLLTGRDSDLGPYRAGLQMLPRLQTEVQRLTEDNRHDQAQLDKLQALIAAKLHEASTTIALVQAEKTNEALEIIRGEMGKSTMDKIRGIIHGMQAREDGLLALREETAEAQSELAQSLSFATVCLDILILLLLVLMLVRLQRLQNLVTVCAWTKAIRKGDRWMTFEEYLQEEFGVTVTHGISEGAAAQLQREVDAAHPKKQL